MPDQHERLALFDALSPEELRALQAVLKDNPELAQEFERWRAVRRGARRQLNQAVPDRESLVLHALSRMEADWLDDDEKARAADASEAFEDVLTRHPGLADVVQDVQSATADWDRAWNQGALAGSDRPPVQRRSRLQRVRVLAYSLAACLVFLFVFQSLTTETITAPTGQFRSVELGDGSTVRLIGDSQLTYAKSMRWGRKHRKVRLEGQAYFRVTPHPKPFLVETHNARAEALGTQFSVRTEAQYTEVILANGRVTLTPKKRKKVSVMLDPGQVSRVVSSKDPPTAPAPVENLTESLRWTGLLVYHNTPVMEAVGYLADQFDIVIDVDAALQEEELVATFDPTTMDLEVMLQSIAAAFGAELSMPADGMYRIALTSQPL